MRPLDQEGAGVEERWLWLRACVRLLSLEDSPDNRASLGVGGSARVLQTTRSRAQSPDDHWLVCRGRCARKQVRGVRDVWPKPHGGMSGREGLDTGSQSRTARPRATSRQAKGR